MVIALEGGTEHRTCAGDTIVVNLHGALVATAIGLSTGMRISIHVYLTDKRAAAQVVYIDLRVRCSAGLNLMSHETFGECLCRQITGQQTRRPGISEEPLPSNDSGQLGPDPSYNRRADETDLPF